MSAKPAVFAHRGARRVAPENTLPSFKLALAAGADFVELDTHQSKDGVPMVLHNASGPVGFFANVHCAAATRNFLVLENHAVDNPAWSDLVEGVEKPVVNKGYTTVPSGPGLGLRLNEDEFKKQLRDGGYFEPTPQWDAPKYRVNDRLWS